jgi:hypothetical protein
MSAVKTQRTTKASIKRGDIVRVVNPQTFLRCGYPLDPRAVEDEVQGTQRARICKFLEISEDDPMFKWERNYIIGLVVKALARKHLVANSFGGYERTIHTREMPEIKNRLYKVLDFRFRVTGTYCPPSESYDPEYGSEYEPATLDGSKRHKILSLESLDGTYSRIEIEACHVEIAQATKTAESGASRQGTAESILPTQT